MSDERRTPDNPIEADDQALGEAIGSAIRDRVDAPASRPPVTHIAERAAARAKARNTRRAVVGIAASVALVVGGIAVWNALDSDQPTEVIVVDEPVVAPEPAPTAALIDEPPDESQTASGEGAEPVTPESLSTGPVLEWTEFDPATVFGADRFFVGRVYSVGDGRVLVEAYGPEGDQMMVSENGVDWAVIPMPPDLSLGHFDIVGNRWLVTGWGATRAIPQGELLYADEQGNAIAPEPAPMPSLRTQAFFSDDQGATWTNLGISLDGVQQSARVVAALVSGENMVVAVNSRTQPDVASVIVARGLVPDKESIRGWTSVEGDTVSFTRDEYSVPESFELTAEEEDFLYGGIRQYVRLFYSDGGPAQQVAEFPGTATGGYSTADGFRLAVLGYQENHLLTSLDGHQWNQAPLVYGDGTTVGNYSWSHSYLGSTIWTAGRTGSGPYRVERSEGVYVRPLVADLPNGIGGVDHQAVGPAGIAVLAIPDDALEPFGAFPELRLAQGGYEMRYNEPVGGITLWDLEADAAVYEFSFEALDGESLPEGVRGVEDQSGGSGYLVFEDPETGDDLATFNLDDLNALLRQSLPDPADEPTPPLIRPSQPERWMGWSMDGTAWGWQSITDAFDLADYHPKDLYLEMGVGTDFVLARVEVFEAEPSDAAGDGDSATTLTAQPPRWFIATTVR
ncbi:MAG: hypothetical protein OXH23_07770 [bacterium]|nr:hypothetical protein [bacterium]